MIKSISLSYCNQQDLNKILLEAHDYAVEQILIQVFSGVLEQNIVKQLLDELNALLPGVAIIGASSAGEIMDGQSCDGDIIVNATFFEHTHVISAICEQNDDLTVAGKDIGYKLKQSQPKVAIVLGCGLKNQKTIKGQQFLDALQTELPNTMIAGGQAGDNGHGKTTFVFTEKGFTEQGIAAAALVGDHLHANNAYNLSWVPIGKKLTITAVEGSRVYGINHQTPYDIYCHYLGQEVADNLPLSAVDFPFIIEKDGILTAIHATGINDDGSFDYIHDFHVGEQLQFGYCHAGLLALGATETYEKIVHYQPQALFVYSCVSRKWILGADIAVDLSSVAGLAPSAGFFCYGEYFYRDNNKAYFFSQTMTVLSLSESDNTYKAQETDNKPHQINIEQSRQFRTMGVLHRLVETSTREIESINQELATLVRLDSMTGLANRRRFDERLSHELERLQQSPLPLSILMLDVDYFKAYNDTYGHVSGDNCLRGIAEVLRNSMREKQDTAARYGGEEFACILPTASHTQAISVAQRIQKKIQQLNIIHQSSRVADQVTVSIGVYTIKQGNTINEETLIKNCDALLYQAKESGRNCIVGEDASD